MMTQTMKVLRHLQDYGTITPLDALREYGIMRLGARIYDLRRHGYSIEKKLVQGRNRYGEVTHWAEYRLECES